MDSEIVLVILVISVAFFGEAIFGFGAGLISIALLSIFLGVRDAVTLVLIFQLFMGLLIFKTYKSISWKAALPISGGLFFGTILGTVFLSILEPRILQLVLAIAVLGFLAKMIFFKKTLIKNIHNRPLTIGVGSASGIVQGLIGTGGQILMMYLPNAISTKNALRATFIYLFFVTSVIRVVISVPQQLFTHQILVTALYATPFFLISIMAGQSLHSKVSEKYYQRAIYVVLIVSGLGLLYKALA